MTAPVASGAPLVALRKLIACEARLACRTPRGLTVGVVLPVGLLVLFGELPHFRSRPPSLDGLRLFDAEVPVLAALVVAALALLSLPSPLVSYRELGVLRRLAITPVRPGWLLVAQLVVNLVLAALALVLVFGVGVAAFALPSPHSLGGLALAMALCAAALFALGLVVAATVRTAGSVGVAGGAVFFPLIFFAGLWVPVPEMPAVLRHIADYTPLGAAVQAAQFATQSGFPPTRPLLVMAGWAVAGTLVAYRTFRWE